MSKCGVCGHASEAGQSFCSECGADLSKKTSRKTGGKKTGSKMMPLLLAFAAVIAIALFTGYQMMSKKYSEEAVVEQFTTALAEKDKSTLKNVIMPTDSRLKVNDQTLDALFALLDKNPSLLSEIERSLSNESLDSPLFTVKQEGKKYGIIHQHVIDTPGNFLTVESTGIKTVVTLNNSELGTIDAASESREFGPYLAGLYTVKGVSTTDSGKKEDVEEVILGGAERETALALDTAEPKKEEKEKEKEVTEKTVIKEVIREVPVASSGSYYILPHSDYAYLADSDLYGMSSSQLRLARNEIYARYGYIFESNDLQNYFSSQSWYSPNPYYDGSLSSIEKANVEFIKSYE
ncbi:YARHG domain-containing protein [Domibacillus aminovorans]|uniref:YARHG domain-containing protein n=1 Tax=Domibacillus aminovorans TaxID=29332 RepID=A0A177L0R8_9BACI|nr:DUF2116 family Zn-ribbon domain-containing protein [Domibacillus aminovorans]OAH59016.1 hypothetical protein AWH49_04970 [Domibacillus aminovorans]